MRKMRRKGGYDQEKVKEMYVEESGQVTYRNNIENNRQDLKDRLKRLAFEAWEHEKSSYDERQHTKNEQ